MRLVSFAVVEVADSAAIGHDDALVPPFLAEYMVQQPVAAAAWFALEPVVGAHHLFYLAFFYQCLEGRQVGFVQVARADVFRIEAVAVPFGARVYGEVLGAGVHLVVLLVFVQALQAFYDAHSHYACQVGVFTVGFYAASPARVAVDVDGRCPDSEALIAFVAALGGVCGVLGARSSDTATKAVCRASGEKEAAMPIGCGNTVAQPLRATPCRASFHQL